jgi:hypothetical protein
MAVSPVKASKIYQVFSEEFQSGAKVTVNSLSKP